ncbi:MAG: hypothetical protein R3230_00060 [Nitrosopumilaceae archaeon]|nr:hypothetical protein [Nitrosopumilaceae archaeon]
MFDVILIPIIFASFLLFSPIGWIAKSIICAIAVFLTLFCISRCFDRVFKNQIQITKNQKAIIDRVAKLEEDVE